MTLSSDIRRVLREGGGWMTDREICAELDRGLARPVRAKDVHRRLRDFADRGQVEMDSPPDAPNRYRYLREPEQGECYSRTYVQRQYEAAFPDGEFTATDLGRVMGVGRIAASRHARRALAEGLLASEKRGTAVYYRRVRHERAGRGGRQGGHGRMAVHEGDSRRHPRREGRDARLARDGRPQAPEPDEAPRRGRREDRGHGRQGQGVLEGPGGRQMTLVQSSIFDFKPLPVAPPSARWILGWMDEGHARVCSTDAAAMAGSVGQIPTSGTWLRCLPIDRSASYNQWCREWDSRIWWHNSGVRYEVLVKHDGTVQGFLDPWPHSVRFDKEGHKYNEVQKLAVLGIRIGDGVITFETEDGEWSAEIGLDAEVGRWDRHPYRPTYDLEHFAIECHRHAIPKEMMAWRAHYVWATAGLRPFYKTSDHPAVYKEDRYGRVDWAIAPNEEHSQICECAARMGLALELDHEVPALDNRAMWPIEQTCASCLRRGSANEDPDDPCWKRAGAGNCYHRWIWDRRTPAKGLKEKKGRKCACDGDDCDE